MLASEGDEGVDWWVIATLDVSPEKLSTLGHTHGVETIRELGDSGELFAYVRHLGVDLAEKGGGAVG